jgi:hypothetical protein
MALSSRAAAGRHTKSMDIAMPDSAALVVTVADEFCGKLYRDF